MCCGHIQFIMFKIILTIFPHKPVFLLYSNLTNFSPNQGVILDSYFLLPSCPHHRTALPPRCPHYTAPPHCIASMRFLTSLNELHPSPAFSLSPLPPDLMPKVIFKKIQNLFMTLSCFKHSSKSRRISTKLFPLGNGAEPFAFYAKHFSITFFLTMSIN